VKLGAINVKGLLEVAPVETVIKFMLKEVEHAWRVKFQECQTLVHPATVDQLVVVVDLKGANLKDLANKQLNLIFRTLLIELQRFYPELLYRCFILNAPLFFQPHYENEVLPHLAAKTKDKIFITGESTCKELHEGVDPARLPKEYGGECECEATCIYSEKGPWSDIENKVNYGATTSTKECEEFKFNEDEEDNVDLLKEQLGAKMSKNQSLNQIDIPSHLEMDVDDEEGEPRKSRKEEEDLLRAMLKGGLMQPPGMTPMNTQIDEDKE